MGYETTAFVVREYHGNVGEHETDGIKVKSYQVLGHVDLSKIGYGQFENLRQHYANNPLNAEYRPGFSPPGAVYLPEELHTRVDMAVHSMDIDKATAWELKNEDVIRDKYGDNLVLIPGAKAAKALYKDIKESKDNGFEPYRRFVMFRQLLNATLRTFRKEEIFVLTYGH